MHRNARFFKTALPAFLYTSISALMSDAVTFSCWWQVSPSSIYVSLTKLCRGQRNVDSHG